MIDDIFRVTGHIEDCRIRELRFDGFRHLSEPFIPGITTSVSWIKIKVSLCGFGPVLGPLPHCAPEAHDSPS